MQVLKNAERAINGPRSSTRTIHPWTRPRNATAIPALICVTLQHEIMQATQPRLRHPELADMESLMKAMPILRLIPILVLLFSHSALADSSTSPARFTAASFGLGLGGGIGSIDNDGCRALQDCDGTGTLLLVSGHFNAFLGPITLGGRVIKDMDRDSDGYEIAGLIGIRPGRSPVSLMVGPGKIVKASRGARREISVTSLEILIAPHGQNVQYIVHSASGDASYIAFSVAVSLGSQ